MANDEPKLTKPTGDAGISAPTRRSVVQGVGVAAAGLIAAPAILTATRASAIGTPGVSALFSTGVASGDPTANSVVLWTRLAPDPLNGGGMGPDPVEVLWRVATDPDMVNIIRGGRVMALAENGHAVHVDLGRLASDTWYYYQFFALGGRSRIGRTRTFPAVADAAQRMRLAVVSCQHYEQGFYTAWRDIANWRDQGDNDLDFVIHTGDYIYEYGATSSPIAPGRVHVGNEVFSVDDYRTRYAQYRTDANLQDAHANYPFLVIWDDHEVENNYAGDIPEETATYTGADFLQRKRNAYQVYAESMPLRPFNRQLDASGRLQIYRRLAFGDLANLFMLDTRQFRTDQPGDDNFGSTDPDSAAIEPFLGESLFNPTEIDDPNATMLGRRQLNWLSANLTASTSLWNVMSQGIMVTEWNLVQALRLQFAGTPLAPLAAQVSNIYNIDAWDGYRAGRQALFNILDTLRPSNPVVLTGDIHSGWAANLLKDFSDQSSDILAAEFVCTSISSTFLALDPRPTHVAVKATLVDNPHIPYFSGLYRGYCLCDVDRNRWQTTFRAVGDPTQLGSPNPLAFVPFENSPVATDAVIEIPVGFNAPGSGVRLQKTFERPLPSPF